MKNPFLKNNGPFEINKLLLLSKIKNECNFKKLKVTDIKDLASANNTEITFFHSKKYEYTASKTKALFCITTSNLSEILPSSCNAIIVENVLINTAIITKIFYPNSITDDFDFDVKEIEKTLFKKKVRFGKNVLIGKNVKIGKNCLLGHNTIIESNVEIGNSCSIGSNVIIRNTIIKNDVHVLDGCVIGKKGFGFFPKKDKNIRYPHIGMVIINDNVEIGCNATIDRGSMSNTVIGTNTYLDNQIHIAHNNVIGNNCIIAGQVGFAGSSILGDNVMIGGQAGISGHLKIGNNVQIAGGSGVIKSIPDNSRVMGYPAKDLKNFIKMNK
ncbi:UDP-3-O-[3-hydroxymyristoyl] glucosamine N-acyltransferase [Candidatus Pelagibacter ubique]|uniref:UDP-3-O-[3-hydroxymyristoyl] glucosamine N-acyltransferase n=1 Tax=Pelagibacter ubique TaxID=198252 RepID=A0ABX1T3S5_PELUQ|nr:UDP-3-O-(3-hydroxymyristoyl)glucosamine N-acyltransferase [Candidatus Pelagibacter ubique]NMN68089.1 UDP-3-O-[3-hydroxymyristoyl] glucosamine N-acyltransferase [Candidatus Pelagibacter ubique]